MKIRTLRLLTKEGARNVYKNKLMSFASIVTITATLFILGLVLLVIVNVTTNMESMKRDLEVNVYLNVGASVMESEEVAKYIEDNKTAGIITEYTKETKEEVFENVKKDLVDEVLWDGLSADNFPVGYHIKLNDPGYSDQFIAKLSLLSGIDRVGYDKQTLDKLSGILQIFNYVTIFFLVVLMVISILLISNTIRLTVYARKKEIEIMKYVGALDRFIRFPFIIEGMLIGCLGTLCSFLLTSQTYTMIKNGLNSIFNGVGLLSLKLIEFSPVALRILVVNIIFGVTMGVLGSFMSVRKHLNV